MELIFIKTGVPYVVRTCSFGNTHCFVKSFHISVQLGNLLAFVSCYIIALLYISFVYMWLCKSLCKSFWLKWIVKKEHRVADIADVVFTRLRRITNSVTVKEIKESLHNLRVLSRCKGRLKAWFEGICNFLELVILFLFVY